MVFNEQEKKLAQDLLLNKDLIALIAKVFLTPQEEWTTDVLKRPNDEVGELVKADVLAQQKIVGRFNELKRAGFNSPDTETPVAPE
jgi:hypothetical protein